MMPPQVCRSDLSRTSPQMFSLGRRRNLVAGWRCRAARRSRRRSRRPRPSTRSSMLPTWHEQAAPGPPRPGRVADLGAVPGARRAAPGLEPHALGLFVRLGVHAVDHLPPRPRPRGIPSCDVRTRHCPSRSHTTEAYRSPPVGPPRRPDCCAACTGPTRRGRRWTAEAPPVWVLPSRGKPGRPDGADPRPAGRPVGQSGSKRRTARSLRGSRPPRSPWISTVPGINRPRGIHEWRHRSGRPARNVVHEGRVPPPGAPQTRPWGSTARVRRASPAVSTVVRRSAPASPGCACVRRERYVGVDAADQDVEFRPGLAPPGVREGHGFTLEGACGGSGPGRPWRRGSPPRGRGRRSDRS